MEHVPAFREAHVWLRGYSDGTQHKGSPGEAWLEFPMAYQRGRQKGMRAIPGIRRAERDQLVRLGSYDRATGTFIHAERGVGRGHDGEGL